MTSKLDVPLHGPSVNIVKQCRSDLCDVLQSKFGCVAVIDGVDSDSDPSIAHQQRSTGEQKPRFAVTLRANVKVSVWKADLTSFKADAVVNAANTQLQHYGGLALALSRAGGPQIQRESDDFIHKHGHLSPGDAIVTGAGSLPCSHIIHAVGPRLSQVFPMSDISRAEPQLKKAIWSILDRVRDHRLQSVAIPAISSGIFNYPLPQCALTIVSAVKDYCEHYFHWHLPQEIFLVNHDEPSVVEMDRACHRILAPHLTMTNSHAAASNDRKTAKTSTPTLQIGNVRLILKKGQIEEQRTDVIVNTASKDKDLSMGKISSALLQKAGNGIQQEIKTASASGPVIITKAYKLQCKNVYHTFCIDKGKDAEQHAAAQKILSDSVSECIWLAATDNHKSIAFPAIGTGALGFQAKEVAQIMLEVVAGFAQNFPRVMEVHVVIYPHDNNTFQAFEEQMRNLQEKVSHPSFEFAFESRDAFNGMKAPSPRISLSGPSEEATREAERWLQNLLFESAGTVVICNNFILHFGKKELGQLSNLTKMGVSIEEFYEKGRGGISMKGDSTEALAVARLQVEALLCKTQMEFVKDEEHKISHILTENVSFQRKSLHLSNPEFRGRLSLCKNLKLWMSKVEKVENPTLEMLFELKKQQLNCPTFKTMFQCIPAQFCEMVSCIGFHAEYAPPEDPAFGEGIYFARTVKKAMEVWKGHNEEFVYFVEAEVLVGVSSPGKPGLILPPAPGPDPQMRYNSVTGGYDIAVIFSGYQALPRYIITCKVL
uniref:protein mono-ADP-ribosyltransferase PARP9 n=1 Tax=Semicossyphus pulcher TaxID=241346 RepID=UPI0037E787C7